MRGPCATMLTSSGLPPRRSVPAITRPYEPNRNPWSFGTGLTSSTMTFGSGAGGGSAGFTGSGVATDGAGGGGATSAEPDPDPEPLPSPVVVGGVADPVSGCAHARPALSARVMATGAY